MATFYIEAIEDTNITLSKVGTPTVGDAYYGVNDHNVPNAYTYGKTIHLTAGQKCYWFITSTSTDFSGSNSLRFASTAKINVGGNLSDLIGGDTKIPRNYCFRDLFMACTKLIDASNLVLVNDFNSKRDCYNAMFYNCTSLTTPPALPATTLTIECYYFMFNSCTSLTTAPALPATTLTNQCYGSMFGGCTSLTTPPELPATILDWGCYRSMFKNCTSLTTPPELPATTLADFCYEEMFKGCTNIKLSETQTAPYSIPYRIPSEGVGTATSGALSNMFTDTGGTFTGTPTINTVYYMDDYSKKVQLYDGDIKLYPITKAENVKGLNKVVSDTITDQKGVANGIASLGSDGKVQSDQLPQMDYIPTDQKGAASGVASLGSDGKVPTSQIPSLSYISTSQKGEANGVASLGSDGKILISQLPIYDGTVV